MNKRVNYFVKGFQVLMFTGSLCMAADWTELKDCVLVENAANDADSFHVRCGKDEHLLRLYFVDAPETSTRFPERVHEQSEWFGTTDGVILHFGGAATEYVKRLLSKPFTVYTQFADARGASSMQRVFAMVKVGDRYLCELLVEQGFARIYGMRCDLPNGTSKKKYVRRLADLEKEAQWKKTGLWKNQKNVIAPAPERSRRRKAEVPDGTVTLSHDVAFYATGSHPTFRGYLRKGDAVKVLSVSGEMAEVQAPFRGNIEPGSCKRQDLGL